MTRASSARIGGNPRVGILVALLLAVLAGVLVFVAISRSGDGDSTIQPPAAGQLVEVARATRDIPARTEITPDMVEVVFVPVETRLTGAFTNTGLVVGRVTTVTIFAGEQFIASKAATRTELAVDSLAYVVPPGLRAIAVTVDRVISPGGLLRPGDRVDIITVIEIEWTNIETGDVEFTEHRAMTIAQDIEVLAIDEALQIPGTASGDDLPVDQPGVNTGASVATLAIPPANAQDVFLAESRGSIRLTVRAEGDHEILDLTDSTALSLVDPEFAALVRAALAALAAQGN